MSELAAIEVQSDQSIGEISSAPALSGTGCDRSEQGFRGLGLGFHCWIGCICRLCMCFLPYAWWLP
jgi:hypothetical protein